MAPQILTIVTGISGIFGLLGLLAYLYFKLQISRAERSIREIVEGEGLFNAELVVEILKQFTDDDARLEILGKEFLIATFGNGTEAYNMYRRIGKPVNLQAPLLEASAGAFPRSLFYPINTANLNASIAQKADLTTQVFWDSGLTLD